ncbi:MAG: TonB family protein [Marinifilaceae bacterium]|jgi:TonB family protein|nr:TonB family protein [Marinifilaceae bacterium]
MKDKRKYKTYGILGSLIFHVILILILFAFGFKTELPLPEEEGIMLNFGNSKFGRGSASAYIPPKTKVERSQPKEKPVKAEEKILTQDTEDAPSIKSAEQEDKERKDRLDRERRLKQEEERRIQEEHKAKIEAERIRKEKERKKKIEQIKNRTKNAFSNSNSDSNSKGNSEDQQGAMQGSPDSNVHGSGGNGLSDKGVGYSLSGRNSLSLPKPKVNLQETGKVIVEITVDKEGNVVKARPGVVGSTTNNSYLLQAAKKAALKAKFNKDENAASYQQGTITYIFELN